MPGHAAVGEDPSNEQREWLAAGLEAQAAAQERLGKCIECSSHLRLMEGCAMIALARFQGLCEK